MYRLLRLADNILDKILALALLIVLLIGVYFVYDTAYVFYHASADRVAYYRPGSDSEELESSQRPFTDDYVAWLSLDDTGIEHPVMQGQTNSEYLNKDPYGDYSLSGSIFLDSRNAKDFSDSYCLIYGHHMSDNLMFGALDRYFDESYFLSHRNGKLILNDCEYRIEIFAVLMTDAGVEALFEPSGSEAVVELAAEQSTFYLEPANNHILALSTCRDAGSSARTVVLATLTEEHEVTET